MSRRGYLFFVTNKVPSRLEDLHVSNLDIADYAALGTDYVVEVCEDKHNKDAQPHPNMVLKGLYDRLYAHGFHVALPESEDGKAAFKEAEDEEAGFTEDDLFGVCSFVLTTGSQESCDNAKKDYFKNHLAELKNRVALLTLDEFACSPSFNAYSLTRLIEDDGSDAVFLDEEGFYSMDDFIRELKPNTTYFFSRECGLIS